MERIPAGAYYRLLSYLCSPNANRNPKSIHNRFCEPPPPSTEGPQALSRFSPFDRADADIILRSLDNIDFRVHKMILMMAGGANLLSQTTPDSTLEKADDGILLLRVDAVSEVLAELLRMCYPPSIANSSIQSNDFPHSKAFSV